MLKQRILTALIALSVLAIVLFVVPPVVARAAVVVLILAGAWEWGGFLAGTTKGVRVAYTLFIAALVGALLVWQDNPLVVENVFRLALAWWLSALVWMLFFPTPIPRLLTWVCGALVLVPAWAALDFLYRQTPDLLIFVLLIVWVADIGAFFVGKGFGRVKLAPQISPGKTWEGVLGGLTAVVLLAAVGSRYFDIDVAVLVPFCVAVAMLSVVGDLTVSMFKRTAGIKDSGSLFPGHGGVLDRIDSVTAASPLFALALAWVGLR
jgi:phosphatidate cytidylyltransferase